MAADSARHVSRIAAISQLAIAEATRAGSLAHSLLHAERTVSAATLRGQRAALAQCQAQVASLHVSLVLPITEPNHLQVAFSALKRATGHLGAREADLPEGSFPTPESLAQISRFLDGRLHVVSQALHDVDTPLLVALEQAFADIGRTEWVAWTLPDDHGPWDPIRDPLRYTTNRRQIHPALVARASYGALPGTEREQPTTSHPGEEDTEQGAEASIAAEALHYVREAARQASAILGTRRLAAERATEAAPKPRPRARSPAVEPRACRRRTGGERRDER